MKGLHNDIGHPGHERTTQLVRERFYWPGMTAEVDQWITRCERCLKRKSGVDRAPRLPIDSVFENACAPDTKKDTRQYIEELSDRMKKANKIVNEKMGAARLRQNTYYDRKAKTATLSIGDQVLVMQFAFEGKHKIADKYEEDLYEIVDQPKLDIPVYTIRRETDGKERTLKLRVDGMNTEEEEEEEEEEERPAGGIGH